MHPDKAPGLDGFSPLYHTKFWEVVREDVFEEVLHFLNNDHLEINLNITQMILLPQKENSVTLEDFRPISLCNAVMKLITKVLANRLTEILPPVISPNQSAFLKNRLITDNILLLMKHVIVCRGERKVTKVFCS